jgi:hypothetical protein
VPYNSLLDSRGGYLLFIGGFPSNVDLRSSPFKRNFVRRHFHQADSAPVFGFQVLDRERIRNSAAVESGSLISAGDEHSHVAYAAATDMNQFRRFRAIAVEYPVTHCSAKCAFNEILLAVKATGRSDLAHEPVHKR